jgi:hypothetical protein
VCIPERARATRNRSSAAVPHNAAATVAAISHGCATNVLQKNITTAARNTARAERLLAIFDGPPFGHVLLLTSSASRAAREHPAIAGIEHIPNRCGRYRDSRFDERRTLDENTLNYLSNRVGASKVI